MFASAIFARGACVFFVPASWAPHARAPPPSALSVRSPLFSHPCIAFVFSFFVLHLPVCLLLQANLVFSHDTVKDPVGTVAFCIGPLFKPWNWLPFIFFHTIRPWHDVRMQVRASARASARACTRACTRAYMHARAYAFVFLVCVFACVRAWLYCGNPRWLPIAERLL